MSQPELAISRRTGRLALGRGLCLSALIVLLASGCRREVTRISNGSTRFERPISGEAYAAFGRARLLEQQGDVSGAIAAYREVLEHDSEAAEAHVRIGALTCAGDPKGAARSFSEAEPRSARSAELYQAKARCALLHRRPGEALVAAQRALQLAQDQETSLLLIEAYRAAGQAREALRAAWAHVAVFPNDSLGWSTLAELVGRASPLAAELRRRAAKRIPTGVVYAVMPSSAFTRAPADRAARTPVPFDRRPAAELDLQIALIRGDERAIHRAARLLGLGTLELVARAMATGAFEFARKQATLAGRLEPDDPKIWQLRLKLADLLRDDTEFDALLEHPPEARTQAGQALDFAELFAIIERRTGVRLEAAKP